MTPRPYSTGSIIVAYGLSYSKACGIFPAQGSNLCLLYGYADSLPLSHQGNPENSFYFSGSCRVVCIWFEDLHLDQVSRMPWCCWDKNWLWKLLRRVCDSFYFFFFFFFLVLPVYCYQPISLHPHAHMLSHVTPWTAARLASLFITISQSLVKLMSTKFVMPPSHLILCRPLLLLPSIFPSIRVCFSESSLLIKWPKCWSVHVSISPSNVHPGLISFRIDWGGFWLSPAMKIRPSLTAKFPKRRCLMVLTLCFCSGLFSIALGTINSHLEPELWWEGGSGWRTHVNPWLIYVNVWQKPLQYCQVISLQLIKKIILKRKKIKEP